MDFCFFRFLYISQLVSLDSLHIITFMIPCTQWKRRGYLGCDGGNNILISATENPTQNTIEITTRVTTTRNENSRPCLTTIILYIRTDFQKGGKKYNYDSIRVLKTFRAYYKRVPEFLKAGLILQKYYATKNGQNWSHTKIFNWKSRHFHFQWEEFWNCRFVLQY